MARASKKRGQDELTEELVDLIAEHGATTSSDLASFLGLSIAQVRNELRTLERLGIVVRTGTTRGTRWHLG